MKITKRKKNTSFSQRHYYFPDILPINAYPRNESQKEREQLLSEKRFREEINKRDQLHTKYDEVTENEAIAFDKFEEIINFMLHGPGVAHYKQMKLLNAYFAYLNERKKLTSHSVNWWISYNRCNDLFYRHIERAFDLASKDFQNSSNIRRLKNRILKSSRLVMAGHKMILAQAARRKIWQDQQREKWNKWQEYIDKERNNHISLGLKSKTSKLQIQAAAYFRVSLKSMMRRTK